MSNFDDFDLDVQVQKSGQEVDPKITSKSLCTPGCITGVLMCLTDGCNISNSCIAC